MAKRQSRVTKPNLDSESYRAGSTPLKSAGVITVTAYEAPPERPGVAQIHARRQLPPTPDAPTPPVPAKGQS